MSTDGKPPVPPARREWKIAVTVGLAIAVGICVAVAGANWEDSGFPKGDSLDGYARGDLSSYARAQEMYKKGRHGGKDEYARSLPHLLCTRDAEGWPVPSRPRPTAPYSSFFPSSGMCTRAMEARMFRSQKQPVPM